MTIRQQIEKASASIETNESAKLRSRGQMARAWKKSPRQYASCRERRTGETGNHRSHQGQCCRFGTSGDGTWAAPLDYQTLSDAFLASLRNVSLFDGMLAYAVDVPLNQLVNVVTTGATAASTGEGQVKVLSRIALSAQALTPRKAVAIIAVTSELMRTGGVKACGFSNKNSHARLQRKLIPNFSP